MTSFGKFFSKIQPGMCRLSMNGIAINVNGQYKTYDVNSGILTNCDDFVFDVGDDMFFAIPCNHVVRGDIILTTAGPAAVISVKKNEIKALDYKTGTIVNIVPERHVFFGSSYFYSKIVSPMSNLTNGKNPVENMLPFMMFNEMNKSGSDMSKTLGMAMLMGGGFNFKNMFGNMFNFSDNGIDEDDEDYENDEDNENESIYNTSVKKKTVSKKAKKNKTVDTADEKDPFKMLDIDE